MNESDNHNAEGTAPANQERVLIEDYRGPAAGLPPSVPPAHQVAVPDEIKPQPHTEPQTSLARPGVAWLMGAATLGRAFGAAASVGFFYPFIISIQSGYSTWHYMLSSTIGILLTGLAFVGLALSGLASSRSRLSSNRSAVLSKSLIGLGLNGLAFLLLLLGYTFGW